MCAAGCGRPSAGGDVCDTCWCAAPPDVTARVDEDPTDPEAREALLRYLTVA